MRQHPLIAEIQAAVCQQFRVALIEMTSARRARSVARPRQVAMFLAKELTEHSLPEIGRRFGNRDHTTVMHAVKQIARFSADDPLLAEMMNAARRIAVASAAARVGPFA